MRQSSLDCRLREDEWDEERQQIILPRRDAARRNYLFGVSEHMNHCRTASHLALEDLKDSGRPFGIEKLNEVYLQHEKENDLRTYAEQLAVKLKKNGQKRTARAYRGAVDAFVRFNGGKLRFDELTPYLIEDIEHSMKSAGLARNTTSHYMSTLRAICNKAFSCGLMSHPGDDLFLGVFTGVAPTTKRALPEDELLLLFSLDLLSLIAAERPGSRDWQRLQGLYTAWRLFFFSFHACGMCFVDLCCLKKENILADRISYRRHKTERAIDIPLTEEIQWVIDSFAKDTANSPYVFPLLFKGGGDLYRQYDSALHTHNHRLKQVASLAGLESFELLSSHVARHSWASLGKNKQVAISIISSLLGHSSEKTTHIYLTAFDLSILAAANRLITKNFPVPAQIKSIMATG
jgi:integrase